MISEEARRNIEMISHAQNDVAIAAATDVVVVVAVFDQKLTRKKVPMVRFDG